VNPGDREDLLFLYAADALDDEERRDVERWVAQEGDGAQQALAQAEEEVAALARALAPVAPHPAVRARLRRRIEATRGSRAGVPRWGRLALVAGLAGLLAGGGAFLAGVRLAEQEARGQLTALEERLAEVEAERDALDEELAELEAAYRALQSEQVLARKAIETLSAEHTEALVLVGTPARPHARARVYWDWDAWYCYLRAEGLEPDPDGVYALWLFTADGDVIPVGAFDVDPKGRATLLAPVPRDVGEVVRAGVSVEPDDRLGPGPRGKVVLVGEIEGASTG
jgi:hypothetical protein